MVLPSIKPLSVRIPSVWFFYCTIVNLSKNYFILKLSSIVCKFGMPSKIFSNRDSRFLSRFWQSLMRMLQCTVALSSGYHPQTDDQSERFHRSIEQILWCYIGPRQSNWVSVLLSTEFSLNSTIHVAHGKSPFLVVYGHEPSLPLDTAIGQLSDNQV